MKSNSYLSFMVVVILISIGTGCRSTNLVFTTYTKMGLDASAINLVPTQAMFGYKRFEGAIIPVDPNKSDEMASVYAALSAKNGWFKGLDIYQVFATGDAAIKVSEDGGESIAAALRAAEEASGGQGEKSDQAKSKKGG